MNKLEQIEKQFNFKYPELYKELFENGMLDWGDTGPNRIKKLIILANEDSTLSDTEKQVFNSAALELLAKNTGCAEEAEIVEGILDELFSKRQIINQKDVDDFYAAAAITRWL